MPAIIPKKKPFFTMIGYYSSRSKQPIKGI